MTPAETKARRRAERWSVLAAFRAARGDLKGELRAIRRRCANLRVAERLAFARRGW